MRLHKKLSALTHIHAFSNPHRPHCLPAWCLGEKKRSGEYIPGLVRALEKKVIQRELMIGLGSWFHGVVRATVEETVPVGRIDIRFYLLPVQRVAIGLIGPYSN